MPPPKPQPYLITSTLKLPDRTGLFVTDPVNVYYLSGFRGSGNAKEAYLLITGRMAYLLTNSLYTNQAETIAGTVPGLSFIRISRTSDVYVRVAEIVKNGHLSQILFDENSLTYREYLNLKQSTPARLNSDRGRIAALRTVKTGQEIAAIRYAAAVTDKCLDYTAARIKPGITEQDIARDIESFIRERGLELSFAPIVAFGQSASEPHYITAGPGAAIGSAGPVLLDFGAGFAGYHADMTRMVHIGRPSAEFKSVFSTVLSAHDRAVTALKQGIRSGAALDRLARNRIRKSGLLPYTHSLGHSIGLEIHENPRLTEKQDAELTEGMVFSIEPAVYLPGKFGIRIEDLVYISAAGPEILSLSPKELIVI